MATGTVSDHARRNGSGSADGSGTRPTEEAAGGSIITPLAKAAGGLLGSAAGAITGAVGGRLSADLDDRDPDYIRENLPFVWLLSSLYFRAEVRNLGNVPENKPVLLVGNHSGGNVAPETFIFTLAFATYFGVERPYYQLAHNLVIASPYGQILRKYGTVSASHENAKMALESGAALLVFPGGDWEVHRPSWERNKVDFNGRKGFIKLAMDAGVPIVPVVTVGGQETALFLSRGAGLAKLLRIDRLLRLKVLPISISAPWGLNIGDLAGHIPLPAKITSEVLEPIDISEQFGDDPDIDEVYEHVTGRMQDALDALAAERRFPVIG
jgi:1-acyl-sn-glycerol-3-phosphate acyltransferase